MSITERVDILRMVEPMSGRKCQALSKLGIPKSNYYRWRQGQTDSGNRKNPWNRITPDEGDKILAAAMESPELSCRQLAAGITDNAGFAVSESTVYRILRREGLVKRQETQLKAAKSPSIFFNSKVAEEGPYVPGVDFVDVFGPVLVLGVPDKST